VANNANLSRKKPKDQLKDHWKGPQQAIQEKAMEPIEESR